LLCCGCGCEGRYVLWEEVDVVREV
jgi:hypothetical protein